MAEKLINYNAPHFVDIVDQMYKKLISYHVS